MNEQHCGSDGKRLECVATIGQYIGKSQYSLYRSEDVVSKEVHWYLMTADNYHSKPQREEFL